MGGKARDESEESEEGEEEYLRECLKKAEEEVSAKEELTFCLYFGHRTNSNEEEAHQALLWMKLFHHFRVFPQINKEVNG